MLDSSSIKWVQPKTLVRFRGMIQDMLGNEFYAGAYKDGLTWSTNRYSDVSQFPDGSDMKVWERRLLYCVPVPGQNQWTECSSEELKSRLLDLTGQNREKRARVDEEMSDSMEAGLNCSPFKKMKVGEATSSASESQQIYDSPESDLKLNDVAEFLGVLTFDQNADENSEALSEAESVQMPSENVPRLHCIIHRKLETQHFLNDSSLSTEAKLHPGRLNSVGVENAKLLKNLLECQKVEYDFQYYKMEMATDAQMLIFSEGKSNIMPADVVVPFQPSQVNPLQVISPETAEAWRCYLAT
ncbi:unnamed protein product [Brassica oleracea]